MENKAISIAVIDDDDTFQFITQKAVNSIGRENKVLPFGSSTEAMIFLQENAKSPHILPDILLLDINMPVLDGWMFLEEFELLKPKIKKEIKIFMISSSIDANDIARAKQNKNIAEYLMKPISIDKFRELIHNYQKE